MLQNTTEMHNYTCVCIKSKSTTENALFCMHVIHAQKYFQERYTYMHIIHTQKYSGDA